MQLTHPIMLSCQAQSQHGHPIGWSPAMIFASHLQKLLARKAELSPVGIEILINQIVAESIVTCGYWGVRCKERASGHHLARFTKSQATGHQLATALQIEKSGMAFIDMP